MHDRTVVEWISEPQMAEARRLLVETDESVEGIGAQIEYDDPRYFARRFQISHGRPLPHGAAPTRLCRLLVARKYGPLCLLAGTLRRALQNAMESP
jgi:AraC-like DNA-binding protein